MPLSGFDLSADLEQKIRDLTKPGMVFGEPLREGSFTIIPVSRFLVRPNRVIAQPVGAIVIGPDGVNLRYFRSPFMALGALVLIAGTIFWSAMLILHPPWNPTTSLLNEVSELIKTIRD